MTVLSPLRRVGLSVVALAASATLVTACSSSTSGNPIQLGGSSANSSAPTGGANSSGVAAGGGSTGSSAPGASASALPTTGGGTGGDKAAFCQQLQSLGSDLGSAGNSTGDAVKSIAEKFQKLAAVAPPEIKPDLDKMAAYLSSIANGKVPDASATSDYSAAAQNVLKYLTSACI